LCRILVNERYLRKNRMDIKLMSANAAGVITSLWGARRQATAVLPSRDRRRPVVPGQTPIQRRPVFKDAPVVLRHPVISLLAESLIEIETAAHIDGSSLIADGSLMGARYNLYTRLRAFLGDEDVAEFGNAASLMDPRDDLFNLFDKSLKRAGADYAALAKPDVKKVFTRQDFIDLLQDKFIDGATAQYKNFLETRLSALSLASNIINLKYYVNGIDESKLVGKTVKDFIKERAEKQIQLAALRCAEQEVQLVTSRTNGGHESLVTIAIALECAGCGDREVLTKVLMPEHNGLANFIFWTIAPALNNFVDKLKPRDPADPYNIEREHAHEIEAFKLELKNKNPLWQAFIDDYKRKVDSFVKGRGRVLQEELGPLPVFHRPVVSAGLPDLNKREPKG
jgi:hypothetical protein